MMEEVVGASSAVRRANTRLISLFGALALVVSLLGVYAVTAYAVSQRTREFGIRAALGATSGRLFGQVGRETAGVATLGILIGVAGAWALARVVESLLYGVTAHDTATFVIAPTVLGAAVLAAALVPARRVLRVNPAEVIRAD
jgi:ABC-type antimicrobial peptide transport system permease subunit